MLKLTKRNGKPTYVRPEHITTIDFEKVYEPREVIVQIPCNCAHCNGDTFDQAEQVNEFVGEFTIVTVGGTTRIVTETPEEILEAIQIARSKEEQRAIEFMKRFNRDDYLGDEEE